MPIGSTHDILDPSLLVLLHRLIEQVRIELHKKLKGIVHHPMYRTGHQVSQAERRNGGIEPTGSNVISSFDTKREIRLAG